MLSRVFTNPSVRAHESLTNVMVVPKNCAEKNINEALDAAVNSSEGVVNALSSAFGALEGARSHQERRRLHNIMFTAEVLQK